MRKRLCCKKFTDTKISQTTTQRTISLKKHKGGGKELSIKVATVNSIIFISASCVLYTLSFLFACLNFYNRELVCVALVQENANIRFFDFPFPFPLSRSRKLPPLYDLSIALEEAAALSRRGSYPSTLVRLLLMTL